MSKNTQEVRDDVNALAEDARALLTATVDVDDEKVSEARKRLTATLDGGMTIFGRVKEQAVEGVKATDKAMHEHPYQAIGIAFGVGALLGCLASRRCSCNGN
jgi:ElaB/YqjD/DUF883 family membrane-anchored ribosome-binding protein